jgi:hypothetical protein
MNNNISIFDNINNDNDRITLLNELKKEQFHVHEQQKEEKRITENERVRNIHSYKKRLKQKKQEKRQLQEEYTALHKNEPLFLTFNKHEIIIQAEFYHQCKNTKMECFLEVGMVTVGRKYRGRIDIIIKYKGKNFGIECKQDIQSNIVSLKDQLKRYKQLDIPIFLVDSIHNVELVIQAIKYKTLINEIYHFKPHDDKLHILKIVELTEIN